MCAQWADKVFISGTFVDIRDFREEVFRLLTQNQYLTEDLSWRDPRSVRVKDKIDGALISSDFFVCILGDRYGTRVEDGYRDPSWTHYEFETFLKLVESRDVINPELTMVVLRPKAGSAAAEECKRNAELAYDGEYGGEKLSPEMRERDRNAQKYFKLVTKGGKLPPVDPDLIDPDNEFVPIPVERASRTYGEFGDLAELRDEVNAFINAHHRSVKANLTGPLKVQDRPPVANLNLRIPASLCARISPASKPAALCVVTTKLPETSVTAQMVADALAYENPWDDDQTDRRLNVSNTDGTFDTIVKTLADVEFAAFGETQDEIIEGIASSLSDDNRTLMIRLEQIRARGTAKGILTRFWPKLQKAIAVRRSPGSNARLLLIVSVELGPNEVKDYCELPSSKPNNAAKPILLTKASVLPDNNAGVQGHKKGSSLE